MKNYYEILGISENAPLEEIKKVYEQQITKYKPENFQGDAKKMVETRIEEIKEAYSVLSDDFLRSQYDKEIAGETSVEIKTEEEKPKTKQKKKENKETTEKKEGKINKFIEKRKEKKKNRSKLGTIEGMKDVTHAVFSNLPKVKLQKPSKKGALALLAAIAIVLGIGLILWFLPFTNGFMRSFLLLN